MTGVTHRFVRSPDTPGILAATGPAPDDPARKPGISRPAGDRRTERPNRQPGTDPVDRVPVRLLHRPLPAAWPGQRSRRAQCPEGGPLRAAIAPHPPWGWAPPGPRTRTRPAA